MKKYLWGFCSILLSSLVLAFPVAHQARAATSKASTRVTTKKKTDAKKTKSKKQNQREALSAGFSASEALMMSQKRFNFVLSTSASRGLDEFADTYFSDISFSTSYRLNTWSALSLSIAYNTIALNSDGDLFNNEVNQPDIYGFSNLSVGWSVPGIYRSKSKKTSINYFASLTAPTSRVSQRASMIGGLGNGIVMRPLQGLTDALTISEYAETTNPKVVLSWAPHVKALPHAVANSFVKVMQKMDVEFVMANPKGYDLDPKITLNTPIYHNQTEAFKNADFIYTKNWSAYNDYGKILNTDPNWMITKEKIGDAKFMHCLPVRRNMVVEEAVLDGKNALVIQQANNRTYAAQLVLKKILEHL